MNISQDYVQLYRERFKGFVQIQGWEIERYTEAYLIGSQAYNPLYNNN
jgi:hypothetical protein